MISQQRDALVGHRLPKGADCVCVSKYVTDKDLDNVTCVANSVVHRFWSSNVDSICSIASNLLSSLLCASPYSASNLATTPLIAPWLASAREFISTTNLLASCLTRPAMPSHGCDSGHQLDRNGSADLELRHK